MKYNYALSGLMMLGAGAQAAAVCRAPSSSTGTFTSPSRSSPEHSSCPADSVLSCSNGETDTCCYEGSNGIFLSTQFWDYSPATGADDLFTLHGLWSDKCAGGYGQFCNPSWEITNATTVLEDLGYTELLAEMNNCWKNQGAPDDELWLHEFNKHGTCMATLNPDCYASDAAKYQYVGDFYTSAVDLWKTLPTYQWLTSAGIYPSETKTYTADQISSALAPHIGDHSVYLGCDKNNALDEVWYFFKLKGSVADGEFIPIDSVSTSSCKGDFYWYPKGHSGGGGGDDGDSSFKATLNIDGQSGCLISNGKWFTSGTCATYNVTTGVFGAHLTSSKGPCNVVDNAFTCGSGVSAGDFTLDGTDIVYGGESTWSADHAPSSNEQVTVSSGSGSVSFKITYSKS